MRGLNLLDLIVILTLLALLLLAGRYEFRRYEGRTIRSPTPTTPGADQSG